MPPVRIFAQAPAARISIEHAARIVEQRELDEDAKLARQRADRRADRARASTARHSTTSITKRSTMRRVEGADLRPRVGAASAPTSALSRHASPPSPVTRAPRPRRSSPNRSTGIDEAPEHPRVARRAGAPRSCGRPPPSRAQPAETVPRSPRARRSSARRVAAGGLTSAVGRLRGENGPAALRRPAPALVEPLVVWRCGRRCARTGSRIPAPSPAGIVLMRLDEDALPVVDRFAVRIARVIDESRVVSTAPPRRCTSCRRP